jgi:hypothetical protein
MTEMNGAALSISPPFPSRGVDACAAIAVVVHAGPTRIGRSHPRRGRSEDALHRPDRARAAQSRHGQITGGNGSVGFLVVDHTPYYAGRKASPATATDDKEQEVDHWI